MQNFKKSTAWAMVLCLILSLALSVGPMAAEVRGEAVDPYVYYYQPTAEQYPAYYERYARPYMLYSGHSVHHHAMEEGGSLGVRIFNVVNTAALIEDESKAPAGGYATTGAFCSDAETYIVAGTSYRRMNLEDGYFNSDPDTASGTVDARKIRAVLRNSMPETKNMAALEKKINAYLTATYGDEAVLLSGLTGTQVISATQAAIWHYANDFDFSAPYPYIKTDDFASWDEAKIASKSAEISYTDYPDSFMDIANDTTATNINGVYQYLLSLPGENAREIFITEDSVSLAEAVISGSGDNCTLTAFVAIDGTINSDDVLTLSAKCGDQTKSFSLGSVNTLNKVDGLYPITFTNVSEEDCASVELTLSGEQTVDDVCFFQAKPTDENDARKASQNLAGYGYDTAPVYSTATEDAVAAVASVEITKVDEKTGNPLSGVSFDLYKKVDGNDLKIGSYITNADGMITVMVTDADEYYFVETEALDGYEAIDGKISAGEVPNSWYAGSLEVSKKLINTTPAEVGETFHFKLTLDLSTAPLMANSISWLTEEYLMGQLECSKKLSWTVSGDKKLLATFTLNADEAVSVGSIPLGTTYTLEEIQTEEDREWFKVTTKVDNDSPKKGNTASGTIAEKNAVLFTNSVVTGPELKLGDLDVSKKLINTTPAEVGETFNFKITVDFSTADVYTNAAPWMNDEYLVGLISSSEDLTWTEKDGKYTATFTVDAEETVTIKGLAYGTSYTVEEVLTAEDREWFVVTSKVNNETAKNSDTVSSTVAERNAVLFTNSVVTTDVKLGDLAVSKKLINTTPAEVGETFNFKITVDFSTADVYNNALPWMNDEYLMGLISSSEDLTWTEKDGKYTATFTVDAEETVTIKGLAYGTSYTVEEVLTAEDREWFTVTSKVCNEDVQNSDTAEGSIAELNAVLFTNSVVTTDVKLGDLAVSKKLINTTPAEVGETFNFKITVDFSTADVYNNALPWMNDEYLVGLISSSEDLTWTEKDGKYTATFTVDAEETVTIKGLAYGTSYTVEEVLTAEDREWFTVTSKVCNEDVQNSDTAEGSIAELNAVLFTNSVVTTDVKLGDLDVSKKLINTTPAEVGETFNFKITLDFSTADAYTTTVPWMNDEYLMGFITSTEDLAWTEAEGKYTAVFTVDADETVTIKGLAYGTTFTVEEILTEEDREWFKGTAQIGDGETLEGSVAQSTVAEKNAVLFTNSVVTGPVLVTGSVEVSKKLVNTTPAQVGETFNFQITVDLSTADVYKDAAPWMNDEYLMSFITGTETLTWVAADGKYTAAFTVNADETFSINGIAQGATYAVQEILTEEDREWFTVTSQIGEERATDANTVQSTVAENNAVLFTNSVVTGPELKFGDPSVSKKLINTTPAEVRENFDFQITVDFSTADVYTNAAPWMNDEYLLSFVNSNETLNWTEKDGKYTTTFTVDANGTVTIAGIAYGATYTIQELLSEEDREWFAVTCQVGEEDEKSSDTVERTVGEDNAIVFTNTVVTGPELVTGAVEVSKKLINTTPAKVGETFNFQITVDLSTADVYKDAAPWMNHEYLMGCITSAEKLTWTENNGKYTATFTVAAGKTVTIDGIARGATYTVQEILTEAEREWFTVTSQIGEERATDANTVQGTVAQKNAVLFTNSVVTGIELAAGRLMASKEVTNVGEAKAHEHFTFRITIDLSTADIYQDPAPWMYDEYLLDRIEGTQNLTWTKCGEKKYTAIFTLKAGEMITIDGMAQNISYTLEEVMTKEERLNYRVTTSIATNGGNAVEGNGSLVSGSIAKENTVVFTNHCVEQIPITNDISLTAPLVLCLMSVLMAAVLVLNKRRLIG